MSQRTVSVEEAREIAKAVKRKKKPEPESPVYPVTTEPVKIRLALPVMNNKYYRHAVAGGKHKHAVTYLSAEAKAYHALVLEEWAKVGVSFRGRLAIRVGVVWSDNRWIGDVDGVWKCLLDSLALAGAYKNDKQIKLEIGEEIGVERPGWVDVILGPKPGDVQGTLFDVNR